VRISIGTDEDMDAVIHALEGILSGIPARPGNDFPARQR
jgi:hypothetical protein